MEASAGARTPSSGKVQNETVLIVNPALSSAGPGFLPLFPSVSYCQFSGSLPHLGNL